MTKTEQAIFYAYCSPVDRLIWLRALLEIRELPQTGRWYHSDDIPEAQTSNRNKV